MRKNNHNKKNNRMKKYISVFFSILFISLNLFAQEDIKPVVTEKYKPFDKQKFNALFSGLNTKLITTNLLVDKVIQYVPFEKYNGTDTSKVITYSTWKFLYSQVRGSQMETYKQKLPAMDSILYDYSLKSKLVKQFYMENEIRNVKENINNEEFIPISVIDINYNEMRKDAFDKELLVIEGEKIKEGFLKSEESPYLIKKLYAATALTNSLYNGEKVTFLFDENFYYTNKELANASYEIDFDDGLGFRKMQWGKNINVSYSTTGEKHIVLKKTENTNNSNLRAVANNNSLTSTFVLNVAALSIPAPTFTIAPNVLNFAIPASYPHGGVNVQGTAYVYTSDGSQNIRNPIIISDGFDPLNERGRDGLYTMINQQNFIECLRANGYDLIILDFGDGGTYIEKNAYLLKGLIENINNRKTTSNKLIVVGTSMAGLVSRYALAYMETNGIDHDTRLYVSFDSPEKGANIPLGIQKWVKFFSSMSGELSNLYNNMLCCPAARQMLVYHSEYSPDPTNNLYRIQFLQNLNNLGYPTNLRKIAIANGAGNTYGQRKDNGTVFNPTDQIITWNYYDRLTLDLKGNSWAVPNISPKTTIFDGKIDLTWIGHTGNALIHGNWSFTDHSMEVTMENSYPYDNAPGGFNPTAKQIADSNAPYGDITTAISNHCFIPTISSLAINTTDLFYNISTDANILSKTPFDMIYYPINTNEEHANISPACVSWLLNELVPQHVELDGINDSWNKGEVKASGSITLKPGFSTVLGVPFHAYISLPLNCY
jgi:hypothetical protein